MEEPTAPRNTVTSAGVPSPPPAPPCPQSSKQLTLVQPSPKRRPKRKPKLFRLVRSVVRSFPIITPTCNFPVLPGPRLLDHNRGISGTQITGTLFGHRKGKVSLSIQETSRCLPTALIELPMQMMVLQKELGSGMVRIALECEKRGGKDRTAVMEEEAWTMYCNGKYVGVAAKREATAEDLNVMELLKAVTMGVGVLPAGGDEEEETAYIRAHFEHVVGSKDSETLYMLSPEENVNGPELSMFFMRI